MKGIVSLIFFATFFCFACQTPENPTNNSAEKQLTPEDSLYRSVLHLHDEVMPKIGKLRQFQNEALQRIDSLDVQVRAHKDQKAAALKSIYASLHEQLAAAEKGMDDWMDSFQPDPKFASEAEAVSFWKAEEQKTRKMRDDIMRALDSAAVYLKK